MYRLIVLILATVDAVIAAAVGLALTLAPLTLLWVLGMSGTADWATLWPASASIWQLGHLVPLSITLPAEYLAVVGIDQSAASFVLSLAPLGFAAFTAIFAARSGARASKAEAWITGVLTGTVVFTALAVLVAITSANSLAATERWQAIVFPALVFAVPLLLGALVTEWREAGTGIIARLRDRVEATPHGWGDAVGLIARGGAVVVLGLIGAGALILAVALVLRGGEVIALFEAGHVDVLGATVVTLAQLAYLPTLAVWGLSFIAGPGFAVGTGTAVSPAGTQLGVIPGIPVLGALPESTTTWLLLLALIPIALGALAGWIARSRLVGLHAADAHDPIGARLVIAVGIAVIGGGGSGLLALLASGSFGPGRLAELGPQPGPVALAVGLEVLVGAGILLLSPRRRTRMSFDSVSAEDNNGGESPFGGENSPVSPSLRDFSSDRVPLESPPADAPPADAPPADAPPTLDLGPRRPGAPPPVD